MSQNRSYNQLYFIKNMTNTHEKVKIKVDPNQYDEMTHREHVYKLPDTYIGDISTNERIEWLLDIETMKVIQTPIAFQAGIRDCSLKYWLMPEIILSDQNELMSIQGPLRSQLAKHVIVVKNYGLPIPVATNDKGKLVPTMIFGSLLSGSNYTDERYGSGKNGYGAKLTNIFSNEFVVMIGDSGNEKTYKKTWRNNMIESDPEIITNGYTSENYVIIAYNLDFKRFNIDPEVGYPEVAFKLFSRLCMDMAFTMKVPVIFNGKTLFFKKPEEFVNIYFQGDISHILGEGVSTGN